MDYTTYLFYKFVKHMASKIAKYLLKAGILRVKAVPLICVTLVTKTIDDSENMKKETFPMDETVNYNRLIQYACSSSSNSSSHILTLLMQYIIQAADQYKNELNQLTNYIEESIEALSYNFIQPELEQDIIASRHQMQTKRAEYLNVISMIPYVENLVNATVEVSFLVGCEQLSSLISEQLYSVREKIKSEISQVKEIEKENLKAESQLIYQTAEKEKRKKSET